ncbi:MAG: hypothetical protein H7Y16_03445 [Candidatus Parcubacteria bacterium]|nr:hypothetical protein [Burkholderiales bacterium]
MASLRGVFFFVAACAACFADSSVKMEIYKPARLVVAFSAALFVVAEAIALLV